MTGASCGLAELVQVSRTNIPDKSILRDTLVIHVIDFESNCSDAKEEKAKLSPGTNVLRQNYLKILTCQAGRQLGWGDIK